MSTIYSFQIGDRTHTVYLDTIVRQLRDRIAQGRLRAARHIHSKLSAMHATIAMHPLVVATGEELRVAEAMADQQRQNEIAERVPAAEASA